jgi:hypothetical protein
MSVTIPENIGKGLSNMDKLEATLQAIVDSIAAVNVSSLVAKKVTLNGKAYTPVNFGANLAAAVTSANSGPFNCAGLLSGTFIVNPDGSGAQTIQLAFTKGTSLSGANPSLDISAGADNKFKISVDGDVAEEVTLTLAGLNSGAAIAAEMQTKIRALGGSKTTVTVTHNEGGNAKYLITSSTNGSGSRVVITPATANNVTEELKIGATDGGTETTGTGAAANAAAFSTNEVATWINANTTGLVASNVAGKLVITSDTTGKDSSIVMGNSTLKTVLGIPDATTAFGAQGLGVSNQAANTYKVCATLNGATDAAAKGLSIKDRTVSGFNILCETTAAVDAIDLLINP